MRLHDLFELRIPKNQWELLISRADKGEMSPELIALVKNAYSVTAMGSMVQSMRDVLYSDWKVLDWDRKADLDVVVFYRQNRSNEMWTGNKIQGMGHDGQRGSKDRGIKQLVAALNQPGWWIEASDALRAVLLKNNVPIVNDEETLKRLFGDPNLTMIDQNTYTRVAGGETITETVFGKPNLK